MPTNIEFVVQQCTGKRIDVCLSDDQLVSDVKRYLATNWEVTPELQSLHLQTRDDPLEDNEVLAALRSELVCGVFLLIFDTPPSSVPGAEVLSSDYNHEGRKFDGPITLAPGASSGSPLLFQSQVRFSLNTQLKGGSCLMHVTLLQYLADGVAGKHSSRADSLINR